MSVSGGGSVSFRAAAIHYAWRGWVLGALLAAVAYARWRSHAPLQPAWLGLAAAGLWWRWLAGRHISGHSNGPGWAGPELAVGGPYRYGRHPLYLSNLAVISGLVLYAQCLSAWGAASALAIAFAHHSLLARYEERYLAAAPGAAGVAYRSYMQVTPRWLGLPRGDSAAAAGSAKGAWSRQGANLLKACACVILLWLLAVAPR